MTLSYALDLADKYVSLLRPHCERIEIAGSIRRRCPKVNDIEVVCIPKKVLVCDMFGGKEAVTPGFVRTVNSWEKVKGEPTGKYTQRVLPEGVKLDLFMATRDNWGLILAIRTGSARYSHKVLANTWVKLGYRGVGGMLHYDGKPVSIKEEIDLFRLLHLDYVNPKDRI